MPETKNHNLMEVEAELEKLPKFGCFLQKKLPRQLEGME
jgi:hypothetical protein